MRGNDPPRAPPPGLRVPIPLAALTLGFHLLPHFSSLLYVRRDLVVIPGTCVTFVEIGWMAGVGALVLLRPHLPKALGGGGGGGGGIALKAMGWIWFGAAMAGPAVPKLIRGEIDRWCFLGKGSTMDDLIMLVQHVSAEAAWPAMWIMGLGALLPVASPLYETPPEESRSYVYLRKAHVEAGMLVLWWSLAHGMLATIAYALKAPSLYVFMLQMIPFPVDGVWYYSEGVVNGMGWAALILLVMLWGTNGILRDKQFEWFTVLHRLASIGFVLFCNLHDYSTLPFLWPGLVALLAARLKTKYFTAHYMRGGDASEGGIKVTAPNPGLIRLSVPDTNLAKEIQPGQHLMLRDKELSYFQWHPITVSEIDREYGMLTLHVKDLGDWSREFCRRWEDREGTTASIEYKGPYGSSHIESLLDPKQRKSGVLLVAGGVGITGLSEAAQRCAAKGMLFGVVWIVRTEQEARTLGDDILWNKRMEQAINKAQGVSAGSDDQVINRYTSMAPPQLTSGISFFQIYITKEQQQQEDGTPFPTKDCEAAPGRSGQLRSLPRNLRNEKSSSSSLFAVTLATSVATIIVFVLSRQFCCMRSVEVTEIQNNTDVTSWKRVCGTSRQCAAGSPSQQCEYCDLPDEMRERAANPDELPCCEVKTCHLCFRGLTVTMVFILGPMLAWALMRLWEVLSWCWDSTSIRYRPLNSVDDDRYQSEGMSEAQSKETFPVAVDPVYFDPNTLYEDPGIVSIRYGKRPDMGELMATMKEAMAENNENANGVSDEPIVLACGPDRLLEDVRKQSNKVGWSYMGL